MRELVFLLEEPSARELLQTIVPQILGNAYSVQYIVFDGKQDLEKKLTFKLKYYCNPDAVFIVMRDQDSGDCMKIKAELKTKCEEAGKSHFLIRIACHELETFYLADLAAVEKAFGKPVAKLQNKQKYRNPDDLSNAKEELQKLCPAYSEISGSRKIAPFMDITNTRSMSFSHLVRGIKKISGM